MDMNWLDRFPVLSALGGEARELLVKASSLVTVPADTVIFSPGQQPDSMLLVLDGTVRVQHLTEKGREIVLYRVRGGESCVLTTSCLLAHEGYSATGITETEVRAVSIPRKMFDNLLGSSSEFRQFVFHAYSRRIADLFLVVEDVAFQRMDVRLAYKLLELAGDKNTVRITHQQLAAELGTAREVVSRQLAEFQRRNWIEQTRGNVTLLDTPAIERLSHQ